MLPKSTSGTAKKKFVIVLGALLALNAAVAHMVTAQISNVAGIGQQVKDEQVVVEEASEITDETSGSDEFDEASSISIYTVQSGDTLSGIAQKYGIAPDTIRWANELPGDKIKVGQTLVILPFNGIQYTVQKGDSMYGIAKKFQVDADEILSYNEIDNPAKIQPGMDLLIPDAKPLSAPKKAPAPAPKKAPVTPAKPVEKAAPAVSQTTSAFPEEDTHDHSADDAKPVTPSETKEDDEPKKEESGTHGPFVVPAPGSVVTQGYHAVNAVDFGAKTGSPILAAAGGTVIVAKGGCALDGNMKSRCNGGFGNFIVIAHENGIQTLYAHLSSISVSVGDSVDQGEKIGGMGDSGKSSGTHLHFETHGIKNPFTKYKKGTQF